MAYETGLILNDSSFYAVRKSTDAYQAKADALALEKKSGCRGIYWIRRLNACGVEDCRQPAFGSKRAA